MHLYQKITGIVAMLLLLALVISCGKDEELLKEDQLVGSWSLESQEINNIVVTLRGISLPVDEFLPEEVQTALDTVAVFPENATLTFNQDQTYIVTDPSSGGTLDGTWKLSEDGKQLTITGLDQASQLLGTHSLTFVIQNFTATDLSLLASVSDISLDQFGVSELQGATVSGEYQLALKKQ